MGLHVADAVKNAAARTRRRLSGGASLYRDALAGLSAAMNGVPDGMAGGLLAGVNPIHGLYANIVGPLVGGMLASTALLMITTTSAASLVSGQALTGLSEEEREGPFFLMVVLAGLFQLLVGVLRLGQITRFVSFSVMTGFLSGIAVVLLLNQLPTAAGYEAAGDQGLAKVMDLILNIGEADLVSVALAALTFVIAVGLQCTLLWRAATLIAIVVPSALVVLFDLQGVRIVADIGDISGGMPMPVFPALSDFSFEVITGALAVAIVVLVQGAGVGQSIRNPGGARTRISRDFVAMGAANVASGLFRGLPVGGSLTATTLGRTAGARSRATGIFMGLWMLVIVVVLSAAVSQVAMPALAGLLVLIAVRALRPRDIVSVWKVGWPARIAAVSTFASTLIFSIQAAVAIGVVLSILMHIFTSSTNVTVVELRESDEGVREIDPPERISGDHVTVLDIHGHLFFAGARTLERMLPAPEGQRPVVILRLRGRVYLGATLIEVLSDYADRLDAYGGRLYLTGLSESAYKEVLEHSEKFDLDGPVRAYQATPLLGESTRKARDDAKAWLAR